MSFFVSSKIANYRVFRQDKYSKAIYESIYKIRWKSMFCFFFFLQKVTLIVDLVYKTMLCSKKYRMTTRNVSIDISWPIDYLAKYLYRFAYCNSVNRETRDTSPRARQRTRELSTAPVTRSVRGETASVGGHNIGHVGWARGHPSYMLTLSGLKLGTQYN